MHAARMSNSPRPSHPTPPGRGPRNRALGLAVVGLFPLLFAATPGHTDHHHRHQQDDEQARARAALQRKEFVPMAQLLADALRRHPGYAIEVELEHGDEYEIEILRHDGVVVELHYDARSGRLLKTEIEDD